MINLMSPAIRLCLSALTLLAVTACSQARSTTGVENIWRQAGMDFSVGTTTQNDVLAKLGPPSQIIALRDETVFYYIKEELQSRRLLLIVYNKTDREITYDRAVFFFDKEGLLKTVSLSQETLD